MRDGLRRTRRQAWNRAMLLWVGWALATLVVAGETKGGNRQPARQSLEVQLKKPMIARPSRVGEEERWEEILKARRPSSIVALCDSFGFDFPDSPRAEQAWKMSFGAYRAMRIKSEVGLSGEFFEAHLGDAALDEAIRAAARGEPESAFKVARAFASGKSGVAANPYRHEQWLRFAADLGHAQAAWDLSQRLNVQGLVAEAAHYEARARENGYKPAPRLSNRDY